MIFYSRGHIIFPCFNGGRVGLWQKITRAGLVLLLKFIMILIVFIMPPNS